MWVVCAAGRSSHVPCCSLERIRFKPVGCEHGRPCLQQTLTRSSIPLLQLVRHRNLQFVQWTIHCAPHHPIMVDVVRRILETTDIYRTYKIEMQREAERRGWGWQQHTGLPSPPIRGPWDSIQRQWVWTMGHWRIGWHPTSIEEWTGPAAWTDSVVS